MRASMLEATRQGGNAFAEDEILFARPWGFDLSAITVPVHLWQGALDVNVPVQHARHLASVIPGAELTVLPDEAHLSLAFRHGVTFAAQLVD
jgi:pimeloyl-ACP methyl ester carboxylesterase